jgi:hypothetical protein
VIAFYNPAWNYYVHQYANHPYIYYLPHSPYLYYDSSTAIQYHPVATGTTQPKDLSDLLDVFVANNLGNLTSLRYPPYSSRRFQYYQDW